ncbi:MAG TPA: cytidylate kinase family protein [Bryobacteraceae bacterium]|nr:cytidylate kinase family protein [Bryobacteraceae bacterium]
MAILTISGAPASRYEEVAHGAAQLLGFEFVTESRLSQWMSEEFGDTPIPDRAWRPAAVSILARVAVEHHLVICLWGAESLFPASPFTLRAGIVASEARRIGNVMLDQRLERPEAKAALARMDREAKHMHKVRLGRTRPQPDSFDVMLNTEHMDVTQMGEVLKAAAGVRGLREQGLLPVDAEARMQFETRLKLARHGIVPAGHARLKRAAFNHPSEEVFANLLDFYRIPWEYEPRSFPLQWDKDGRVIEAFTPDFYLPEFDLYLELTTMKQTLVTRKNRKIKMLRAVYPHINIQVFYQKDIQDLVFKHGLKDAVR